MGFSSLVFQSNMFFSIGCLMATSIVQGGSGFPFLCKCVYEYLSGQDVDVTTVDYTVIPDSDIRAILDKVISNFIEYGVLLYNFSLSINMS